MGGRLEVMRGQYRSSERFRLETVDQLRAAERCRAMVQVQLERHEAKQNSIMVAKKEAAKEREARESTELQAKELQDR